MRMFLAGVAVLALSVATPGRVAAPGCGPAAVARSLLPPRRPPRCCPDSQIEQFLREARIVRTKGIGKGVTGSTRATLSDGTLTHDAQIQTIDEKKAQFDAPGATEFNFQDSWKFNVAAYRLDRLIGLNMVPVSVPRTWRSKPAAFTWWIDDVLMDEGKRLKDKTSRRTAQPGTSRWRSSGCSISSFTTSTGTWAIS